MPVPKNHREGFWVIAITGNDVVPTEDPEAIVAVSVDVPAARPLTWTLV